MISGNALRQVYRKVARVPRTLKSRKLKATGFGSLLVPKSVDFGYKETNVADAVPRYGFMYSAKL